MSTTQTVVLVLFFAVIVAAVTGWIWFRHGRLRRRFGPEYDYAVAEHGDRAKAEQDLRAREREHTQLSLRPVSDSNRELYWEAWSRIQARFLDDPAGAVEAGEALLQRAAEERGYPDTARLDLLSVDHPHAVVQYRESQAFADLADSDDTTERQRNALIADRALLAELIGEPQTDSTKEQSHA